MTTEQLASRRQEMFHALRVSGLLFLGFAFITQQVLTRGWLYELDHYILNLKNPQFEGFAGHILIALDDLGLRWLTATILLISSAIIGWRFKSFRPFNLSLLAVLSLNLVVGATKLIIGRTKPRLYIDVLQAGGMSYPSGHASNALLSWGLLAYLIYLYTNRAPFQGLKLYPIVGLITATVVVVSLIRNTHWFSDLLGGVFIGGALLVAIIAADRFVPSEKQPS